MTNPTISPAFQYPARWQDRASVSKREAAAILARSVDWVELQIADGELYSFQTRKGGPRLICVQSILQMIDEGRCAGTRPPSTPPRTRLQLVWVNPNM